MSRPLIAALCASSLTLGLVACSAPAPAPSVTSPSDPSTSAPATKPPPEPSPTQSNETIVGTVIRFTSDRTSVDVTVGEDSRAVRDLLSMLPLELPFEDFNGREQIAYLPRDLDIEGSPGSDPEDGDLIYFAPWGNLGFYYNAEGIDYSDSTLHIGTYTAPAEQITLLQGGLVSIEIAE